MRSVNIKTRPGESVTIYSGNGQLVLQVRRLVHGNDDPTACSFKSGIVLTPVECARIAAELMIAAGQEMKASSAPGGQGDAGAGEPEQQESPEPPA